MPTVTRNTTAAGMKSPEVIKVIIANSDTAEMIPSRTIFTAWPSREGVPPSSTEKREGFLVFVSVTLVVALLTKTYFFEG